MRLIKAERYETEMLTLSSLINTYQNITFIA
jgi:hypothetical protein